MVPSCLAEAGVLEVVIEFYDKTDMFIHHLGSFLSPNSRSRVDIDKGKFIKIAISHEVVQLLEGEEFSGCAGNFDPDGDYDECIYSNLYRLIFYCYSYDILKIAFWLTGCTRVWKGGYI